MGRKEQRIQKKLEKNPIRELNKIQRNLKKIQLENLIKSKTDIIVSCFGSLPKQRIPDIRAISHIQTG